MGLFVQAKSIAPVAVTVDATQVIVTEIHAAVAGTSTKPLSQIPARVKLPARPIYFNGRDARLNEIVALICVLVATRIAIMGPGGIGKTSLALAVLYDSRVIEVVGDHRFFISVEGMIDIDAASTHLANHLGLDASSDPLSSAIGYLQSLPRALLVVDNLETLWFSNNASACVDIEQFLSRLAEVSSLTLLITSRGAVPPDGVQWSNTQSAELAQLSLDAARDTFVQIATLPAESTEQAVLDTLLIELDCVPLAVTLLAKLAVRKNSPSDILRRWKKSRTKLFHTQGEHRLRSVDVSITVSLDLLKGMSRGVEAMQLLAVCAHLPDGLMRPVFEQLDENFGNIDAAKDMLVEFALVTVGAEGELKMLSPIRYFVLENHKMTDTHFDSLQQIYFDIAASAPQEPADDFTRRSTQFAPEYGNLTSFLLHLINSEEPSEKLFDAVHAVSEYAYCTMPSTTLREALLLRLTTQTAWRAECLQGLGRTRLRRDEYSHATDNLQAARRLFAELGNRYQEAACRFILGNCLQMQVLFDAAEAELRAGRDIFIELGYESDAAECTQRLGDICRRRGEYDQAIDHLTSARDTFKRHGERLYAAQCTRSIGQIQIGQGNLSAAGSDFQSALSEFEALGEQVGAAQCTQLLGEVRRQAFTRLGSRSDVAHCHWSFGLLYRDQYRKREALASFESARDIYEALGWQADVADCNSLIQNLRNLP
ncbi:P-loop containing nucleoside triphosphate hydrolase protein [Auriculariales sp. MPI-PUGE-AT-0066]|nr:P-loop containing nucleoside triphosphate hydrolase protein [Auriculariales sp. MPI-PUGE-AT-0066]